MKNLLQVLSTLNVSWKEFRDDVSGIEFFEYAIGTSPGDTDIVSWTLSGTDTMVAVDTLNLINAQSYYGMVRATDFAGNVSEVSISNGITSDHFDMILVSESLTPGSTINQTAYPDTIRYVFNESIDSNVVTMVDNMVGGFTYEVVDSALYHLSKWTFASLDTIYYKYICG